MYILYIIMIIKIIYQILIIYFFFIKNTISWIINFDLVPNSNLKVYIPSLENCKMHYWTDYNTECMDGCTFNGKLRYGPNYITTNIYSELPKLVGINCNITIWKVFNKFYIDNLWIEMDICTLKTKDLFDIIILNLNYNNKSKITMHNKRINKVNINSKNELKEIDSIYIGAYYMNSISKLIKYKYLIKLYFRYSIIIDLILLLLLLLNSILFKYKLIKLNKIK